MPAGTATPSARGRDAYLVRRRRQLAGTSTGSDNALQAVAIGDGLPGGVIGWVAGADGTILRLK